MKSIFKKKMKTVLPLNGPKCAKNSNNSKKLSLKYKRCLVILEIHITFYFDESNSLALRYKKMQKHEVATYLA